VEVVVVAADVVVSLVASAVEVVVITRSVVLASVLVVSLEAPVSDVIALSLVEVVSTLDELVATVVESVRMDG
jgi:hypothetical protein